MLRKTPLIYAHRGARRQAPENTIPAFVRACELGADGIELDVQLTADGQVVVFHDGELNRVTDGSGKLKEHSLAQLKELDAGSFFDPSFRETRIPTLSEVFEAVDPAILINIELKDFSLKPDLVREVVALIHYHGVSDRILFSSFNPFMLRVAKKCMPSIPVGYLYAPDLPLPLAKAWLANPVIGTHEARHPHFSMVDQAYMEWADSQNYRVNVWTVNETQDIQCMLSLGVDGIITDFPDLALTVLEEAAE